MPGRLTQNWRHTVNDYGNDRHYRYCRACGAVWLHHDNLRADHNIAHPESPVAEGCDVLACVVCNTPF